MGLKIIQNAFNISQWFPCIYKTMESFSYSRFIPCDGEFLWSQNSWLVYDNLNSKIFLLFIARLSWYWDPCCYFPIPKLQNINVVLIEQLILEEELITTHQKPDFSFFLHPLTGCLFGVCSIALHSLGIFSILWLPERHGHCIHQNASFGSSIMPPLCLHFCCLIIDSSWSSLCVIIIDCNNLKFEKKI